MAKKGPNHPHKRDEPAQNTEAPNATRGDPPTGMTGPAQEQDKKRRIGQHTGMGEPALIKK